MRLRGSEAQGYSCLWNSSSLKSPAASASIIRVYRNNNSCSEQLQCYKIKVERKKQTRTSVQFSLCSLNHELFTLGDLGVLSSTGYTLISFKSASVLHDLHEQLMWLIHVCEIKTDDCVCPYIYQLQVVFGMQVAQEIPASNCCHRFHVSWTWSVNNLLQQTPCLPWEKEMTFIKPAKPNLRGSPWVLFNIYGTCMQVLLVG